jgi:hypothetical protein
MSLEKICESCGMPLRRKEDFGGNKIDNKYCIYCTDKEGNLKSYQEVLDGMKNFAMRNMGVSEDEAFKAAKENMAKMPAWKNIK